MSLTDQLKKASLRTAFSYLEKNPEENAIKLLGWVDKLAGDGPDSFESQRLAVRRVLEDPSNNMYRLTMNIFHETDPGVLKATFENFFLNANIIGWPVQEEYRKKYNCNIPWAILLDPTSACNLHCTGCWAAEYGNRLNLSLEEIDSIVSQGKQLGVYMYIYTGGEPLVRKKDLIAICEKHSDCQFLSFTNATLIDEAFADEMLRVKNFIPAISVEGFEEATDGRRGSGTYQKVIQAMSILKRKHLPFGLSCCYTSQNLDSISSFEFIDQMVEWGARFVWYFHYMPVGNDASPELLPTAEDGTIAQQTEKLVGPYELHDFYLYYVLRFGFSPAKIYHLARTAFDGKYEPEVLLAWLKNFYRRFFAQQFKRSCLPDGPKVGSVTLSPRGDWRMPSDACNTLWMAELEKLEV